jgi:hypothetical protein
MLSHDGTSELYATVEEVPFKNSTASSDAKEHLYSKVTKLKTTKGKSLDDQPGSSKKNSRELNPSSDSETYTTSLNISHHPYTKIKRPNSLEHPYAKLGNTTLRKRTESAETAG